MSVLARNWWALVIRGVLAILFGVMAFIWPGLTLAALVLLFGAYALVDGIFAIVTAVTGHTDRMRWWTLLVEGVIGIGAGLVTFFWPDLTALVLITIIGVWAILTGVFEIVAALRLRQELANEWFLILSGVLSVVFGVLVLLFPGAGALALVWAIGGYAVLFGLLLVVLGVQLRTRSSQQGQTAPRAPDPPARRATRHPRGIGGGLVPGGRHLPPANERARCAPAQTGNVCVGASHLSARGPAPQWPMPVSAFRRGGTPPLVA